MSPTIITRFDNREHESHLPREAIIALSAALFAFSILVFLMLTHAHTEVGDEPDAVQIVSGP